VLLDRRLQCRLIVFDGENEVACPDCLYQLL
jgi:hypothetical protein